ncbi:RNA pseudouridine synthase 5 isoform X1 [Olea europaea var. sylvestris]|uniref:RNA pseudouridine synthase 5 isoform X1 n=1 Tax=Olea europaea var. sylvestris TaxID=158386 RepID=UPI000C1D5B5B|nr:RNA pseudouridine synthase 5 isoform X1 [Olea europaea var. sylvestris]
MERSTVIVRKKNLNQAGPITKSGSGPAHNSTSKFVLGSNCITSSLVTSYSTEAIMQSFGEPWPEFNDGLHYRDLIRSSDSGLTLIEFYSKKYKNSAPFLGWLQRIHNKQITIDGNAVTDPDTILREGMELIYYRLPWQEPDAPHLLEILCEDDDLIAVNKPSGLQVLPGGLFQQRTVLTQLQWRSRKLTSSSACQEPHPVPVHRLGRGTSGILLCAKTKLAKSRLAAYFADGTSVVGVSSCRRGMHHLHFRHVSRACPAHAGVLCVRHRHTGSGNIDSNSELNTMRKITKIYRALARGVINEDEVTVEQPIGQVRYPGVAKGLYVASPSGKPSFSRVDVLERNMHSNCTLIQVEIQSGRPHQIRIHLSFIGHPLIGDPLYVAGGQPKCFDPHVTDESLAHDGGYQRPGNPVPGDCGYHLHAHRSVFPHPITNEVIDITASLPSILRTQEESKAITQG